MNMCNNIKTRFPLLFLPAINYIASFFFLFFLHIHYSYAIASLRSSYSFNGFHHRLIAVVSVFIFESQRYALILRYLVPISHYLSIVPEPWNYLSKVNRDLLLIPCKYSSKLVRENGSSALADGAEPEE